MWEKYGDSIALVIIASAIVVGLFFVLLAYDAHPHVFQGAFAVVVLGLIVRSFRHRKWLQRMDCWLEYIEETPRDDSVWDLAIAYRYNDQEVMFYGRKASRERAKVVALPPVESWPQRFPAWVSDKREFLLKSLPYQYEFEWTESGPYPVQSHVDDHATPRIDEVSEHADPVGASPGYRWKIEKTDPNDYKGRSLTYEEPGLRLVVYLEMTGGDPFDWTGGNSDFSSWTEPKDVPIADQKRREILDRLVRWCRENTIRLCIGPTIGMEEYWWEMKDGETLSSTMPTAR